MRVKGVPPRKPVLVEDCRVLDIGRLNRMGYFAEHHRGRIEWGKKFAVDVEYDGRSALLIRFPDGRSQKLRVVKIPMPLGGGRWAFHLGARRAFKLYLPPAGSVFGSKAGLGLDHRCRHLSARNRTRQREDRFFLKYGMVDAYKPHGMWRRTWRTRQAQWELIRARSMEAEGRLKGRGAGGPEGTMAPGAH
jgi:hypothetical protein